VGSWSDGLTLPESVRTHWTGWPNACGQAYMGQFG